MGNNPAKAIRLRRDVEAFLRTNGLQADGDIKQGQKVVMREALNDAYLMRSSFSILPSRMWTTRWACNAMSCS
jgi:hypothetical protein